jgi:predicted DNA binding CopG/RHH family protein
VKRNEQDRLAAEFERDADNDELWEDDPAPVQRDRGTLGAQVTIRLEPALAEQLRQIAGDRGVNYTALLRTWIKERLSAAIVRPEFQMTWAGCASTGQRLQVTGEGFCQATVYQSGEQS